MGGQAFSARTVFGASGQRWAGLVHLSLKQVLTHDARRLCFLPSGEFPGSFSIWEVLAGKMVRKNVMTPSTQKPIQSHQPMNAGYMHALSPSRVCDASRK